MLSEIGFFDDTRCVVSGVLFPDIPFFDLQYLTRKSENTLYFDICRSFFIYYNFSSLIGHYTRRYPINYNYIVRGEIWHHRISTDTKWTYREYTIDEYEDDTPGTEYFGET